MENIKTQSREFALQFLFHLQLPIFEETRTQLIEADDDSKLQEVYNELKDALSSDLNEVTLNHSLSLIKGVLSNYSTLNEKIEHYSKNWKVSRISKVVHTVLLLSIHELLFDKTTPPKVVMDEYLTLSKTFSVDESKNYVNGILDQIVKDEELL